MTEETNSEDGGKKPKPSKKATIPAADIDFGNLGISVAKKWEASPWLTIQWLTVAEFKAKTDNYVDTLGIRLKEGGTRPQMTKALAAIDKQINEGVKNVKNYLTEKYKAANAPSYYAAFGIIKSGTTFIVPVDQNRRSSALKLIVGAISEHGFQDKIYGLDFWTNVQSEYDTLLKNTTDTDGSISTKVGDKNLLKKEIKKGLNSIINILRGNYPDTFKAELRNWGFQKEKY